eukprot:Awhi_evm1s8025
MVSSPKLGHGARSDSPITVCDINLCPPDCNCVRTNTFLSLSKKGQTNGNGQSLLENVSRIPRSSWQNPTSVGTTKQFTMKYNSTSCLPTPSTYNHNNNYNSDNDISINDSKTINNIDVTNRMQQDLHTRPRSASFPNKSQLMHAEEATNSSTSSSSITIPERLQENMRREVFCSKKADEPFGLKVELIKNDYYVIDVRLYNKVLPECHSATSLSNTRHPTPPGAPTTSTDSRQSETSRGTTNENDATNTGINNTTTPLSFESRITSLNVSESVDSLLVKNTPYLTESHSEKFANYEFVETPAARLGLAFGDRILSVNTAKVSLMTKQQFYSFLQSSTKVTLKIQEFKSTIVRVEDLFTSSEFFDICYPSLHKLDKAIHDTFPKKRRKSPTKKRPDEHDCANHKISKRDKKRSYSQNSPSRLPKPVNHEGHQQLQQQLHPHSSSTRSSFNLFHKSHSASNFGASSLPPPLTGISGNNTNTTTIPVPNTKSSTASNITSPDSEHPEQFNSVLPNNNSRSKSPLSLHSSLKLFSSFPLRRSKSASSLAKHRNNTNYNNNSTKNSNNNSSIHNKLPIQSNKNDNSIRQSHSSANFYNNHINNNGSLSNSSENSASLSRSNTSPSPSLTSPSLSPGFFPNRSNKFSPGHSETSSPYLSPDVSPGGSNNSSPYRSNFSSPTLSLGHSPGLSPRRVSEPERRSPPSASSNLSPRLSHPISASPNFFSFSSLPRTESFKEENEAEVEYKDNKHNFLNYHDNKIGNLEGFRVISDNLKNLEGHTIIQLNGETVVGLENDQLVEKCKKKIKEK